MQQRNVLGDDLQPCSTDPMTGFYRTGCCEQHGDDQGFHVVCCVMAEDFLAFSASRGNDLSTPMPQYRFPGLRPGTSGASWLPAGPRPSPQGRHARWSSSRPTCRRSSSSTWPISAATP
jgi:uncharacterized protein (DUF2237 family)